MGPKPAAVLAACALFCLTPAIALAGSHKAKKTGTPYYLALGDSLAAGDQPNAAGATLPTKQGYANDLWATEKSKIKGLKFKDLGCGGESTTSMLKGGPFCQYHGTQLADAVKFIKTHNVVLVTIDIGANDVDGCASFTGAQLISCVGTGLKTIQTNAPQIVKQLRKAAGAKVKIAGMTYYDPFLAYYLGPPAKVSLASESVGLSKTLNDDLTSDFKAQQLKVADISSVFHTYTPFTTTTTLAGHGTVPVAVAKICQYTWMCAAAPRGPNIHATALGYKQIAAVFAAKL